MAKVFERKGRPGWYGWVTTAGKRRMAKVGSYSKRDAQRNLDAMGVDAERKQHSLPEQRKSLVRAIDEYMADLAAKKAANEYQISVRGALNIVERCMKKMMRTTTAEIDRSVHQEVAAAMGSNKQNTRSLRMAIFLRFLKFCEKSGYLVGDSAIDPHYMKQEKPAPKVFTDEEAEAILSFCQQPSTRDNRRHNAYNAIMILYHTGIRIGELYWLWHRDLHLDGDYPTVHVSFKPGWRNKTSVERIIPVAPRLLPILREIKNKATPNEFVFLTKHGKPYKAAPGLTGVFNNIYRHAGIAKTGAHIWRHTFITHALLRGADIVSVKEWAGHKNITTTERYLHYNPKRGHKLMSRIFPEVLDDAD
jgi:site-specific recombinase XerD